MSDAWSEVYQPPQKQSHGKVSWSKKEWSEFTEEEKRQLVQHMRAFETKEAAREYRTYLISQCKVPREFFEEGEST